MLCEYCNRLIGITDTVCPYCGKAVLPRKPVQNEPAAAEIGESTPDISQTTGHESSPPDISDEISETKAAEQSAIEPDSQSGVSSDEDNSIAASLNPSPAVPPVRKALEDTLRSPRPRQKNRYKASGFLVAVAILSILALFSSIVLFILLPIQQQSKRDKEIINFMQGAWISDYFAFYDSTAKNYVEVLTVDDDGNFTMMYTIPNAEYPDGWSTGKWKIEEQISGKIAYMQEDQRLLLLYEEDGVKGCFERFFILKDTDEICLREFYDEPGNSYYDVILHRIKGLSQ